MRRSTRIAAAWLRRARLTGTQEDCADGNCGAYTVALAEFVRERSAVLQTGLPLPTREAVYLIIAGSDQLNVG